ncbi:MAG: hypothetical protein R3E58_07000 [Phycisphaerae bacterium]|nr:hypothetical protein [Phycisphaerales bacterium]
MMQKKNWTAVLAAFALMLGAQTGCTPSGGNNGGGDNGGGDNGGGDNGGGDNGGGDNGGGDNGGGDNGGGDNGGGALATAVKTNIDVHNGGRIGVGDDLLVYGYGGFAGVDYIIPSAGDTEGRGLPNGENYVAGAFAVTGRKVALLSNFLVTIFDADSGTSTDIPEETIRLVNSPVGLYAQGIIRAAGGYVVCRNDPSTNGGNKIIAIDVTGDTPEIISFTNDPEGNVNHIEIDATNMEIAAKVGNMFYIYDIENPDAAPVIWDLTDVGGIGDQLFSFDDGYIFYEDNEAFGNARWLKTDDGTVSTLAQNPSQGEQCYAGGEYIYFVDREAGDNNGGDGRGATGQSPGLNPSLSGDEEIDGSTTNNGFVGWSQTCTISPNGAYRFMSGSTSIGSGEFLQYYNGSWSVVPDADGSSEYGLPATDAVSSNTLVGFKTGDGTTAGTNTKVGYIILN